MKSAPKMITMASVPRGMTNLLLAILDASLFRGISCARHVIRRKTAKC